MSATFKTTFEISNVARVVLDPIPKDGREARKRIADELARLRPDMVLTGSIGKPIKPGIYLVCHDKR